MPFLTLLFSVLGNIPGLLGTYFTQKAELAKAATDAKLALEIARIKAAADIAVSEAAKANTIINATSPRFKYITFFMWFAPFILGVIHPPFAKAIFDNMLTMPGWYTQSVITIMFTIWGISVASPVISNIFSGLNNFIDGRREYKLNKIDRQSYYDAMRKIKGVVTEADVKRDNAILDELEKTN